MSSVARNVGIPARLLVLVAVGGALLGLMVSLLAAIGSSAGSVVAVNTSTPIQLSPLALQSKVYDANGKLIAVLQNSDFRRPVTLSQVPPIAVHAILDVEDKNFYTHGALDLSSIIRAAKADLSGQPLQGASTITQQLIKQTVLNPNRKLSRKLHEAILAIQLFHQMSRNQILGRYLNTVYFGNGAYGIGAAAYTYFGEKVGQLSTAQSALLAAMIENPSYYDPITDPTNSLYRRNVALDQMVTDHSISQAEADAAKAQPLPTKIHTIHVVGSASDATFLEEVVNYLENDPALGPTPQARYNSLFQGGLSIYTTLNPTMQAEALASVAKVLPNTNGTFTAALVALDPANGEVRALVPGNNSPTAGFDVVTGLGGAGGRQAGSSFKLFTLLGLISQGYSITDTVAGTGPCYFKDPGEANAKIPGVYVVNNAGPEPSMPTVAVATADSINCAYMRMGLDLGLPAVVDQAAIMGVTIANPTYPSLIIGSEGVQPIDMAGAYATLADGGYYHKPTFIDHVVGPTGKVLIPPPGQGAQVVSAQDVAIADSVFQQVIQYGTGTAAALPGRPAAGKTGTTDNYTNAWFDGYTPQLATVVWMGDPNGNLAMRPPATPITVYGGTYPTQIWHDFMTAALAGQPVIPFPTPPPLGPGRYLPPPAIDVSGIYGQAAPQSGPTTSAPAPPTCSTSSSSTSSSTSSTTSPTTSPSSTSSTVCVSSNPGLPGAVYVPPVTSPSSGTTVTTAPTGPTYSNPPGITCTSVGSQILCQHTSTTTSASIPPTGTSGTVPGTSGTVPGTSGTVPGTSGTVTGGG